MASRQKCRGMYYEWEFKTIIEAEYPNFFVWHIGGSTPGWDNLLFKLDATAKTWKPMIPFENKSFNEDRKVYKKQIIDQFKHYSKLYTDFGIVTFYSLRHKKLGVGLSRVDRWRVVPVFGIELCVGPNGGEFIVYEWEKAMPLDKMLDIFNGKAPTHDQLKKWKWLEVIL